ncbi:MAG: alanine dehydrogenase [Phycisphaeraceae bacterium]|nr:alanine dehydrogenase [Phycisphaeraceae bacterium]
MIIGIPKETKQHEYRVSVLPVGVELLTKAGHQVLVQTNAGVGSGYEDRDYEQAGATLIDNAEEVFGKADMIVKVKEPLKDEWPLLRQNQIVFTYFHFAASHELTQACLNAGITAVAYETLTDAHGTLPLLTPMSEVAGRMSIQEGAKYLEKPTMGRGILLGGVPGVEAGEVLVLGAGVVGTNAARIAAGLGARVVIMDINLDRLRYLDDVMPPNVHTVYSDPHAIAEYAARADLIIGAVLIPGGRTPVLIPRDILKTMKPGSVIVDVGVDQGGCVETSRPTSHAQPTFIVDNVVHYCVSNMPGAVGRTSTQALCHATQPYVLKLANTDLDTLIANDPAFASALNMRAGKITHDAVARAFAN